ALDRALRGSLKKAVKADAPTDIRARMLAAMVAESARQAKPSPRTEATRTPLRHWRTALPLASAPALALAWGGASSQPPAPAGARSGSADVTRAGFGGDVLRDLVAAHRRAYPPEQHDPSKLSPYMGNMPIQQRQIPGATYMGARLLPVHGGETA